MTSTIIKLWTASHHLPTRISTPDALRYHQQVAKIHGARLVKVQIFGSHNLYQWN